MNTRDLNKTQLKLLNYMKELCNDDRQFPLGFTDVMLFLKCGERSAIRNMMFLKKHRFIRVVNAGGGRGVTNIYEMLFRKGSHGTGDVTSVSESVDGQVDSCG